jgi:hypothetical protein
MHVRMIIGVKAMAQEYVFFYADFLTGTDFGKYAMVFSQNAIYWSYTTLLPRFHAVIEITATLIIAKLLVATAPQSFITV